MKITDLLSDHVRSDYECTEKDIDYMSWPYNSPSQCEHVWKSRYSWVWWHCLTIVPLASRSSTYMHLSPYQV